MKYSIQYKQKWGMGSKPFSWKDLSFYTILEIQGDMCPSF